MTRLSRRGLGVAVLAAAVVGGLVAVPSASATDTAFSGRVDKSAASAPRSAVHAITLASAGTISATLTWADAAANLNLLLKDSAGAVLARAETANRSETLTYTAPAAGKYKLNVLVSAGASDYALSVTYPGAAGGGGNLATYSTSYGFPGPAELYAYGMDFDSTDGTILVGDYWNYRVKRFTSDGSTPGGGTGGKIVSVTKPVDTLGGTTAPYDVEADLFDKNAAGKASWWSADQGSYRIVQFDHDGKWLQTIGRGGGGSDATHPGRNYPNGCGNGSMQIPTHIYVDPGTGKIYVSDPQCRAVYIYSHTGTFLGQLDFAAAGVGMAIPRGLAAGPDGKIYVVEFNSRSIVVFNTDGSYVRKLARQADMNDPRGLDIDPRNGDIVVVAGYFNEIFKFSANPLDTTPFIKKWGTVDGTPTGRKFDAIRYPAVDDNGNIYVGETWGTRAPDGSYTGYGVYKFTPDGAPLPWATPSGPPADGGFNQQNGIALVPEGGTDKLFVIDTFEQRVQKFNTAQTCMSAGNCAAWELQFGSREAAGTQSQGFGYARALTYGKDRNYVYVGDNNNAILAWRPDGTFVHRYGSQGKSPGQFSGGVQGIRVTGGKVYATDVAGCRLQIFDEAALLQYESTVATDPAKKVPASAFRTVGSCGTGPNQMTAPRGIAVGDAANNADTVYVAETGTSRISKWNLAGTTATSTQIKPSCGGVGLKTPWGITWDPSRTWLYIGDVGNARIVRMNAAGTTCQVVTTNAGPQGLLKGANFIEFGSDGTMYASDNNQRVYRYTITG